MSVACHELAIRTTPHNMSAARDPFGLIGGERSFCGHNLRKADAKGGRSAARYQVSSNLPTIR